MWFEDLNFHNNYCYLISSLLNLLNKDIELVFNYDY